jgi:hypothetical protein
MLEETPVNWQPGMLDGVSLDNRYLACSIETKSEIVSPACVRGKVVGELDIDRHFPAAFGDRDRKLVEYCASLVGKQLEKSRATGGGNRKNKVHARQDGRMWPSFRHPKRGSLLPEVTCRP